ncbi:Vacuolar protein-sorting-associated protein [Drechslerella dactyloides]|uniref:Vacuolar protein-sorting-associated protein n=1 Tax=Drechslerella dactyloides TaxID=74499 RepID=A0AAD6IV93_DREDA|nr:Vacuolar protein-sorting-associated protein [Drechslerella dactyloides]
MWNKFTQSIQEPAPPLPNRPASGPQSFIPGPGPPTRVLSGAYGSSVAPPRLTPRSSSLNLSLSNSSNVSLSSVIARQPTPQPTIGTGALGYRAAVSNSKLSEGRDTLKKLGDILGSKPAAAANTKEKSPASSPTQLHPDEEIDFGGLSIEDFLQQGTLIPDATSQDQPVIEQTVEDYENEKDKFQDLHKSIKACDEVLQSVESYLSAFKTDLGRVSAEIETLQNRSLALNTKLNNRRNVERLLNPILEDVTLPPSVIQTIAESDVNETWVKALQEADQKIKALDKRKSQNIKAVEDVKPELEKLTNRAIERLRDYFVSKIKSLRIPNTNAQIIQQNGFLRYKELYGFMARHHPQLADEIGQAYINTMRWYYVSHFQRYQKALEKLKLHAIEKSDLLGLEDTSRRGPLLPGMKASVPSSVDAITLGRRFDVYKNQDAPLIQAQAAEDDKASHYIELPFRSYNLALSDNAASEFTFISEFFAHKKFDQLSKMFQQIFEPTLSAGQVFTKSLIENSLDALGILLCVRLNQQSAFLLQRKRIPVLENYINGTNILLWPRFQMVMDMHSENLRRSAGAGSGRQSAIASAANDMAKQSAAPHPLTQKFAQFMHSLLLLSSEASDGEPSTNSMRRIRSDFEAFLTKLSAGISDKPKRERFLFNNYSLTLTIISDTEGKLASEQKAHFEALMKAFSPEHSR